MKRWGIILFFLFPSSLFSYTLTPTGINVTVEYDEPDTFEDGTPLTNLKETTIFYNKGLGTETAKIVPASRLMGGGHIVQDIFIPLGIGEERTIQAWATATSTQNITSQKSNEDTLFIDRLPPSVTGTNGVITGNEFEIFYTEPTTKANGESLNDLLRTDIYFDSGLGPVKIAEVPATSINGGGIIQKRILIPLGENTETEVSIWYVAVDSSLNQSANAIPVVKRLDRLPPGGTK